MIVWLASGCVALHTIDGPIDTFSNNANEINWNARRSRFPHLHRYGARLSNFISDIIILPCNCVCNCTCSILLKATDAPSAVRGSKTNEKPICSTQPSTVTIYYYLMREVKWNQAANSACTSPLQIGGKTHQMPTPTRVHIFPNVFDINRPTDSKHSNKLHTNAAQVTRLPPKIRRRTDQTELVTNNNETRPTDCRFCSNQFVVCLVSFNLPLGTSIKVGVSAPPITAQMVCVKFSSSWKWFQRPFVARTGASPPKSLIPTFAVFWFIEDFDTLALGMCAISCLLEFPSLISHSLAGVMHFTECEILRSLINFCVRKTGAKYRKSQSFSRLYLWSDHLLPLTVCVHLLGWCISLGFSLVSHDTHFVKWTAEKTTNSQRVYLMCSATLW